MTSFWLCFHCTRYCRKLCSFRLKNLNLKCFVIITTCACQQQHKVICWHRIKSWHEPTLNKNTEERRAWRCDHHSKTFLSWNNSSGSMWKDASHTLTGSVLSCQEPTVLWLITPQWLKDDFCVKKTQFSDDSPLVANGELQYIKKDGRWWEHHCWATQVNWWTYTVNLDEDTR